MSASFSTDKKIKKVFSILLLFVFIVVNFFGFNVNTARAADAWKTGWTAWGYRIKITVNASKVPVTSTPTNFPVYVNLADLAPKGFFSHVNSDGSDIRVTNSTGTELARQVEAINKGASTGVIWFKADSISDGAYYYIYYGNSGASEPAAIDADGSQNVWTSGYGGVWHMNDNATNAIVTNSTPTSGINGTIQQNTSIITTSGKVDGAFTYNGSSDYVSVPTNASIDPTSIWTLSAWINSTNRLTQQGILEKYNWTTGNGSYGLRIAADGKLNAFTINGTSADILVGNTTLSSGVTYYVVATFNTNTNTITIYLNGQQDGINTSATVNPITSTATLKIGARGDDATFKFKGIIDEARVSSIARSADWIKTEYNNQFSTTAFYSVAAQEAVTVPDAPTGLTPTVGNTQISLSWTAPADGGSPIDDYVVDYKLHSDSSWTTFADGTSTSTTATVINLTNGLSYDFRVSAHNAVGTGSPSATATATPATVPSAPAKGTATKGNASASVAFTPPNDGGSAITGYTVTSSPGSFTGTGVTSPIIVPGLTNGTPYTFTITATNVIGTSPASVASDPVTPATVPGVPIAILATPGNAQVSLSWTAPVYNGDSAITNYIIEYKLNSDPDVPASWQIFADAETPIIVATPVTGLINGTSYDFRISAKNDMGVGNPSTPLVSSTPRTIPSKPTITSAVSGDMQVTVNFSAPANGGAEITGYAVTSNGGGTDSNSGSTNLSHIVTGLTNGTAYTFTVTATNIAGTGPASDPSSSVTPAKAPEVPTLLIATPGNAQVSLQWTAPADNGASITNYVIEYKLHSEPTTWLQFAHAPSPATSIIVSGVGLVNGSLYDFRIYAVNIAGTSLASTPPVSSTPRTIPGAPTITSVERGNAQVTVNFTAPSSDGGSTITGYTVTSDPQGITQSGSASPIIIGGLTNGTEYTFTVKATNVAGDGPASTSSSPVTPATVPGKATDVVAVAGNGQATITFTAPLSTGGSAITGYVVTSSGGGTDSNSGSTNLSHIVTGLSNGSTYTFTIVATNNVGDGLASDASNSITLPTAPTAPLNLAAVVKSSSIDLIWSDPASTGGSAITDYVIEYQLTTGGTWVPFDDGVSADKFTTVTGLANGTSYDFRVSAKNIIGQSIPSGIVTATPGEPAQVFIQGFLDLTNTSIGTAIRITNEGLIEYEYQYTWCVTDAVDNLCGGGNDVFSASNAKLIGSHENYDFTATSTIPTPGNYFFHIKVLYGSQSSSAFQSFTAVATFPDPPTSVTAVAGNAQATVSFTAPASNGGSAITGYTVTSNPGGLTGTGLTTPIIVAGLTNGTAYTFTMTAANAIGTGLSSSPPSNSVTPVTVPSAINSFSASAGNTQVGLFWSAPASDGGSPIIDYVIEYKLSSDSIWAVFADAISPATTITVTGLTNNLSYDFRVSAVNSIGQGPVNSTSATSVTPPPTNTGGGSSGGGGGYVYPPTITPSNTPTTTPNIKVIPPATLKPTPETSNTVPPTKVPKVISPTTPNGKINRNEVSTTPTETSHITPPVKQKQTPADNYGNKETSSIPWVWIIISSVFVLVSGFIIFILRRRRMDDQEN